MVREAVRDKSQMLHSHPADFRVFFCDRLANRDDIRPECTATNSPVRLYITYCASPPSL